MGVALCAGAARRSKHTPFSGAPVLPAPPQDAPTALNLDTLVRAPEDLAVLVATLRAVPVHTVTAVSMRYCALKSDEAVAHLVSLCSDAYENPKPKGVLFFGPNLHIIETLYLR